MSMKRSKDYQNIKAVTLNEIDVVVGDSSRLLSWVELYGSDVKMVCGKIVLTLRAYCVDFTVVIWFGINQSDTRLKLSLE